MYRLLVQGVADYAIYMLNPDGDVVNWNIGAERNKGYRAREIVGKNFSRFYAKQDRDRGVPRHNLDVARQTGRFEDQGWRIRKDGSSFWAHVVIHAMRDERGELLGFAKVTRDCTEQRRHSMALESALAKLDLALANMNEGLCLLDDEQRIVLVNSRFATMFGFSPDEVREGRPLADLGRTPEEAGRYEAFNRQLMVARLLGDPVSFEFTRGSSIISVGVRPIPAGGWVATFDDITERRLTENAVAFMSEHDVLTQLPNRVSFSRHLDQRLTALGLTDRCAVLYVDLDNFKCVNEVQGPPVGDAVLRESARRMRSVLRKTDYLCRLGGDEFAVVLDGADALPVVHEVAGRLIAEIGRPFALGSQTVRIGASIGVAVAPDAGFSADELARKAGIALYQAKRDGRGCVRVYGDAMGRAVLRRQTLESRLRRAIGTSEFSLHYQPVVRAAGGELRGFEALIRWTSAAGATVSPADFIPLAEELGLMGELGGWVLREACREAASWPTPLTIAVNVSATQLREDILIPRIAAALQESGLDAGRLEIEVTETAMIEDQENTLAVMRAVRDMGVMIAIDDFGTGYSSLSFIRTFPFTRIKLDRSFVGELGQNRESSAIVRSMVALSQAIGLGVTAEGVETEEQRSILVEEGCGEIQGYLIARPMPAEEIWRRYFALDLSSAACA